MKFGIVSRLSEGLFQYQGWPTVCRDDDGVLYVGASSFRLGHLCGFGKNVLYVSRDGGESWSCPRVFNDNTLDDRDVGLCYLGGKKLLATWFSHPYNLYESEKMQKWIDGAQPSVQKLALDIIDGWSKLEPERVNCHGTFCRVSSDGGDTWSEPRRAPVTSPHGPVKLKSGKLFYFGKSVSKEKTNLSNGVIAAYASDDEGKSWHLLSSLSFPECCTANNLHEPYAIELSDGTILGLIRAQGEEIAPALGDMCDDLKQYKFTMFKTFSNDGGHTFTAPEPIGFLGAPPHMVELSTGEIVLTYSRRKVGTQGIFARVSRDGGKTFGKETLIGPEAYIWDQGYPSTVELDDGTLVTVYYQRYENDSYCSLLYTKWKLSKIE
jgi:Neuraminidase (sialidase)